MNYQFEWQGHFYNYVTEGVKSFTKMSDGKFVTLLSGVGVINSVSFDVPISVLSVVVTSSRLVVVLPGAVVLVGNVFVAICVCFVSAS